MESVEQIEERHRSMPTRAAIADTLAQMQAVIAASGMLQAEGVTSDAAKALTEQLCNLHLYLGHLFHVLYGAERPTRVTFIQAAERDYWAYAVDGKWHAVLTVRGCDRALGERDDIESARVLCEEHADRFRVIGGGR